MVNFKQKDKQGHFVAGALIGFCFSLLFPPAGIAAMLFAGWFKEQLDKRDPKHHTYDLNDMYATWIGGVVGVLLAMPIYVYVTSGVWKWLIQILM